MSAELVISLYRKHGSENYIGEKITQLEHAIQCAMQAESAGHSDEVILGAFLHDIGHLIPASDHDFMYTDGMKLGIKGHEVRGQDYLRSLGMPTIICDIAVGHVNAKRYLCFKHPLYYNNLSEASKKTLIHQGGIMSSEEAKTFEENENFNILVQARAWDEAAKIPNMTIKPLDKYETMLKKLLIRS